MADVSCPNTQDFDAQSQIAFLEDLIVKLSRQKKGTTPLLIKLSCDWNLEFLRVLIEILLRCHIDGVICGNTSTSPFIKEQILKTDFKGGISGAPLFPKSLQLVKTMQALSDGKLCIIGVGGILEKQHFWAMQDAGAQLVQVFTGLIYKGPQIVAELLRS